MTEAPPRTDAAYRGALPGLDDVIAFLLLLSSPLRFQRPKWVLADLIETGNADVAITLMRPCGVDDDPATALAVDASARVVETAAPIFGLPSAETVRELGLLAEYPAYSYLCHCVDVLALMESGSASRTQGIRSTS